MYSGFCFFADLLNNNITYQLVLKDTVIGLFVTSVTGHVQRSL